MNEQSPDDLEPLRDSDFLLWLDTFLGEWQLEDEKVQVRRRPDGWLTTLRIGTDEHLSLGHVISQGRLVEHPPSLLVPHPLAIFQDLMELWLTPEQIKSLRGAGHVSYGRRKIVETLEQRARELPLLECQVRLLTMWNAHYPWFKPRPPSESVPKYLAQPSGRRVGRR